MNKLVFLLVLFTLFRSNAQTIKLGGTYTYGDLKSGPSGYLALYPESDSTLLFDLEIVRAIDYNLGEMNGRMFMKNKDSAVFYLKSDADCMLSFKFLPSKISINTIEGHDDCGYGYGVASDGIYYLYDKKTPQYFIGEQGDTTFFKNMIIPK